jgi:hypothetical protein
MQLTTEDEFADIPGVDIFHFEGHKIKEAWTVFDALTPAAQLGIVEKSAPKESSVTQTIDVVKWW